MNILLEIDGKCLKSTYSVYIIEIISAKDKYFYIGQTGDSNYVSARSPLRRLIGHLSYTKSSNENQIIKAIARRLFGTEKNNSKSFTSAEKEMIESFFTTSIIKMHSYPLFEFKHDQTFEKHKIIRKEVLKFEKQIIDIFIRSSHEVLNNKIPREVDKNIKFEMVLNEIKKTFEL